MRELLQQEAIKEISDKFFSDDRIYLGEYSTGSGKTKICLESAIEIFKKTNKSVIISAGSSNNLVYQFLEENKEHNLISSDKIVPIIGKKQYINKKNVLESDFLQKSNLKYEDVKDWLEDENKIKKHHFLVQAFIEYFNISIDFSSIISNDDDNDENYNLNDRIDNIVSSEPKIYITNHIYLLIAYKHISRMTSKEDFEENDILLDFLKVPLIIDEIHTLNDTASLLNSNKASIYLIKILLNFIINSDSISKVDKNLLLKLYYKINSLLEYFSLYKEDKKDSYVNEIINLSKSKVTIKKDEKFLVNEIISLLTKISKKKNTLSSVKSKIYTLRNELKEIITISTKDKTFIDISLSPNKKFPSYISQNNNPIYQLRNYFWSLNDSFVAGLSGTLKVDEKDDIQNNRWSLERIGIIKYNEANSKHSDNQIKWNHRISTSIYFTVKPRIFKKTQAKYHIFKDKRYLPPKVQDEKSEAIWIDNIAQASTESLNGNTLILMSSFNNCKLLAEKLAENEELTKQYEIVYSNQNDNLQTIKNKYIDIVDNSDKKGLLIGNLSFYTGVDLPMHYINTLVLGKLPFEPINLYSKIKYGNSAVQYNMFKKAVLTFRQGLGRGLRKMEDSVFISICDPRILKENIKYKPFLYFLNEMAQKI